MTTLEIILIIIIWIGYGIFSNRQMNLTFCEDEWALFTVLIVFTPIQIIARILHGLFNKNTVDSW